MIMDGVSNLRLYGRFCSSVGDPDHQLTESGFADATQTTMAAGAVAALQRTRQAVAAARLVMLHSTHTLLAGAQADDFAVEMGLRPSNLSTKHSLRDFANWWGVLAVPAACWLGVAVEGNANMCISRSAGDIQRCVTSQAVQSLSAKLSAACAPLRVAILRAIPPSC